jgi:modulator of FtsH protease
MEAWHDFLVAQVGASAALGGLLFVGLSLNLEKILGFPGVPERAQITLVMILATLLLGSLLLVPRQEFFPLGIEALAVGIATVALGTRFGLRAIRASQPEFRGHLGFNLFLFEIATIPYVIGGALLFRGDDGGMYWIAAAICISLAKAMLDAWVLLIEINR